MVACSISDELWSDLYGSETAFQTWCDRQIWPQELLQLLEVLAERSASVEDTALELLEDGLKLAKRCAAEAGCDRCGPRRGAAALSLLTLGC